jgi:hypothetical protein
MGLLFVTLEIASPQGQYAFGDLWRFLCDREKAVGEGAGVAPLFPGRDILAKSMGGSGGS